jgi:hypothetical protein
LAATGTGIVDCTSDEFLAGSGFSVNEYRGIPCCNTLDLFQNDFPRGATADDLIESPSPTVLFNHSHSSTPKAFAS